MYPIRELERHISTDYNQPQTGIIVYMKSPVGLLEKTQRLVVWKNDSLLIVIIKQPQNPLFINMATPED
jgi:hypothetical protein